MSRPPRASHFGDAWTRVDSTDDPSFFIRFLDATRARMMEAARHDPARVLAPYAVGPGMQILDVGCATADLTALLAGLAAPSGRAVGIDLSETMIAEARRRHAAVLNLELQIGDVERLSFEDHAFDRVLASQLLIHVPNPARALDELVRVTRRDGRIFLGEMDWDTLIVAADDRVLSRRFTQIFSDALRHPLIVRELPSMLRERGFSTVSIAPQPFVFSEYQSAREWLIDPALTHARADGLATPQELDAFEADVERRASEGRFFAASTFYMIAASA